MNNGNGVTLSQLEQRLRKAPTDDGLLELAERVAREEGAFGVLADIWITAHENVPHAGKLELSLKLGDLHRDEIGFAEEAVRWYLKALEVDPASDQAFEALLPLCDEAARWKMLVDGLLKRAGAVDDEAAVLKLRAAQLTQEHDENPLESVPLYEETLILNPGDAEATAALEALYQEHELPEELALLLHRMVPHCSTVGDKVELLERVAGIAADSLERVDWAIEAQREILELDPGRPGVLARLETLLVNQEDWQGVLDVLDQRIALSNDADEVIESFLLKGDICRQKLALLDDAEDHYQSVLELVPCHSEAVDRLMELLGSRGRHEHSMQFLLKLARQTDDEREQARLFARMGQTALDQLSDADGAIELFEAALQRVPDLPAALAPLSNLYFEAEHWAKALPVLQILLDTLKTDGDAQAEGAVLRKMGEAFRRTGRPDEALACYRSAYDKDASTPEVLEALGDLNFGRGNLDVADTYYGRYLEAMDPDDPTVSAGAVYRRMGQIQLALGRTEAAREWLEKVLARDPNDIETLGSLIELLEAQSDWTEANRLRLRLVELSDDALEKWKAYIAIGDARLEGLQDPSGAQEAYEQALIVDPDSKTALIKLLEMYAKAAAHVQAVDVLERLVELEADEARKVSFCFTAATLLSQELGEVDRAAAAYEQVLDIDPENLDALKALLELLTSNERWALLDGAYAHTLARLGNHSRPDLEHVLYKGQGELYELHLDQPDKAVAAYEHAVKLKPNDGEVRGALAQLHEQAGRLEKAVDEYRALICLDPGAVEAYRKVAQHSHALGRDDDAWFSLSVLAASGGANPQEQERLAAVHRSAQPKIKRPLNAELWRDLLLSKAQETAFNELFSLMSKALGRSLDTKSHKEADLHKRDRVDTEDASRFSAVLHQTCRLLTVPVPEVYRAQGFLGMDIRPTRPPALVVGNRFLEGVDEPTLAFMLARTLTWLHPWHLLAGCYPVDVLKLLLAVAISHVSPSTDEFAAEDRQLAGLVRQLGKGLDGDGEETLEKLIGRLHRGGKTASVSRWVTGVELTSNHAGLLACMDFQVARTALLADPFSRSRLPKDDQAAELAMFAVSGEFSSLRRKLGD